MYFRRWNIRNSRTVFWKKRRYRRLTFICLTCLLLWVYMSCVSETDSFTRETRKDMLYPRTTLITDDRMKLQLLHADDDGPHTLNTPSGTPPSNTIFLLTLKNQKKIVQLKTLYKSINTWSNSSESKSKTFCGVKYEPAFDLLSETPLIPLPWLKNPCIHRADGEGYLCAPYMFLVGAPKCGTTDLYRQLTQHPQFLEPRTKEPNWLSRGRFHYKLQYKDYLQKYFTDVSMEIYKDVLRHQNETFGTLDSSLVTGDASATYLHDNDYWPLLPGNENKGEPLYTNPDYIRHLNPAAKILITIRNPINRLWSDYQDSSTTENKTSDLFHDLVLRGIRLYQDCFTERTIRNCVYDKHLQIQATTTPRMKGLHRFPWLPSVRIECPTMFMANVDIRVGLYSVYIKDYLRVFPRHQIYIQRLEDYSYNISKSMEKVFSFLGISRLPSPILKKMERDTNTNHRREKDEVFGDLRHDTRQLLYDFYKPFNEELSDLLNNPAYNYGLFS